MTLREYILKNKLSRAEAAELFDISVTSVHQYINDVGRFPRPDVMLRIKQKTNGEVTETDFMAEYEQKQA